VGVSIRRADAETDRDLLIRLFHRFLTPLSDDRRWNWLYTKNPHGAPRIWLAVDSANGAAVGAGSAFARRVYMSGQANVAWVLGDFCIADDYRSLGVALKLQRACLQDIDSGAAAFCYDFPSTAMMAVYQRLGIHALRHMVRLAKPLRVDRKVRELVPTPFLRSALTKAGNILLSRSASNGKHFGVQLSLQPGECGHEFSELAIKRGVFNSVCTERSAEYLNWRYLRNPLANYEILTARRDGELLAYAIFSHGGEDAAIVDIFGPDDTAAISALLDALITLLRERAVVTLSAVLIDSHPWIPFFSRAGFKEREKSPIIVYRPAHGREFDASKWFLTYGDRDS
jgi:hypothetical protein